MAMIFPININRGLFTSIRRACCHYHQPKQWCASSSLKFSSNAQPEPKRRRQRGRLFSDRDYHIHLGGAIPPSFIASWINDGQLSLNDEIPDLVAATNGNMPMITVRQALVKYRNVAASELELNDGLDAFLAAYNTPSYDSLPTFLTLYRAYSKRELLYKHASEIARGEYVHPSADIRISIPHPYYYDMESPTEYATRALEEMKYFHSCLLPSQKIVITFPRQSFNANKNSDYFASFIDLLASTTETTTLDSKDDTIIPWLRDHANLAFDFAGQPLCLTETLPLLITLRNKFPSAFISYHHGEVCTGIPFSQRVTDAQLLLPYVNRIGHGLCLGLAILGINPDDWTNNIENNNSGVDKSVLESNRDAAYQCLDQMAKTNIGIEVSPTCNITLGGARNKLTLIKYVHEFLDAGVNIFVGTDDPGFLGTMLEKETEILKAASKQH